MEDLLGVLGLIVYITAILALSAGVTFLVIKISPSQSAKEQAEKSASPS
jgi:hypothetical protein